MGGDKLITGKFPYMDSFFDDGPGENKAGSPKMQEIRKRLSLFQLEWRHSAFQKEPAAQHLLAKMLATSEVSRPSAKEALADPWLSRLIAPRTPMARAKTTSSRVRLHSAAPTVGRGLNSVMYNKVS